MRLETALGAAKHANMPSLDMIFGPLQESRQLKANNRNALVSGSEALEAKIAEVLKDWPKEKDPVTGREWISVSKVPLDNEVSWGTRLTLFNKHFFELAITQDGQIRVHSSNGQWETYEGYEMNNPRFHMSLTVGREVTGEPYEVTLESLIVERVHALVDLPTLKDDAVEP